MDGTSLTIRTYDDIIYGVIGILTLGTRMKITIVFDNGTAYTYLNGELFDSNDTVGDIIDIPSFDIGNQLDLTRAFGGIIHSISIYNRALTPQEVSDRYNDVTFQFLNDTPTPTQQAYLDWQDSRIIGRSR
jgi:hypothetical protein